MPLSSPLPDDLGPVFRIRDAMDAGVPYSRLRASDLHRPFRGVRIGADLRDDLLVRCTALMLRLPVGTVFSHGTAARLHGIPVPPWLESEDAVHVSVPPPRRAVDIGGVVGHRLERSDADVRHVNGLPLSAPWRVFANLAQHLTVPQLVALGDAVLRAEPVPAGIEWWTRRGRTAMRRALPILDAAAESPAESMLRARLIELGLPRPKVNVNVLDRSGLFVARVDMLFGSNVIVEYEGDHHRTDAGQWRRDITRIEQLKDLGNRVHRATAADLAEPADLARRIRRSLAGM